MSTSIPQISAGSDTLAPARGDCTSLAVWSPFAFVPVRSIRRMSAALFGRSRRRVSSARAPQRARRPRLFVCIRLLFSGRATSSPDAFGRRRLAVEPEPRSSEMTMQDFFLDFDPLRCGRCSPHQFVRGLNAIVLALTDPRYRSQTFQPVSRFRIYGQKRCACSRFDAETKSTKKTELSSVAARISSQIHRKMP